jgi:hypothetical protein
MKWQFGAGVIPEIPSSPFPTLVHRLYPFVGPHDLVSLIPLKHSSPHPTLSPLPRITQIFRRINERQIFSRPYSYVFDLD